MSDRRRFLQRSGTALLTAFAAPWAAAAAAPVAPTAAKGQGGVAAAIAGAKDLAALESHCLLLRRYGGAITMPQELVAEPGQSVSKYKQAIARAAVKRIREHARIIIDSGSTTAAMIPEPVSYTHLTLPTSRLV